MAFKEGNCEQCGELEPSGLATCEDCNDEICNACAIPSWDNPGWGNSSTFRCTEFRPPGVTRLPPLWGAARFYYSAAPSGCPREAGCENKLHINCLLSVCFYMETKSEKELLYQLSWSNICEDYSADALYEALTERLEERIDIEEMEMSVILCEIAERLGQRDDYKRQCCQLQHELESLRAIDRERVRLIDQQRPMNQRG